MNRQVYLGSDAFVQRMQDKAGDADDINVPRAHRRPPPPSLEALAAAYSDRDAAMLAAHRTGEYSYAEIARHFGVHFTTVGRVVRGAGKLQRSFLRAPLNAVRVLVASEGLVMGFDSRELLGSGFARCRLSAVPKS
ncbi:MAG: hypothetical protein H4O13_11805 [Xanthomonadales bacterium]|nr:hypothetical protein [Xanthomonadales bacterium]